MALVISLEAGDQFNVGHRRFKIVAVEVPSGVVINELGVGTFVVQATDGLKLSGEIAFQEGLRQQKAVTRLMISAPKSVKIWRGQCEFGASVALLAPVPEEHLISGQSCCEENGRVAFGSRDFEVFRNLDDQCAGAPCHVLIYPSSASQPQAGPRRRHGKQPISGLSKRGWTALLRREYSGRNRRRNTPATLKDIGRYIGKSRIFVALKATNAYLFPCFEAGVEGNII